ncbi:MAG: cytochrome ubiquinol oxidase subunit I [Gammaproteobacteria bacterium]|nr:cytochrome ubiquinol oxidase subunit I [Gammaproteobacteria bacterium]MBP9728747.1 cytochrome ubiquinol oxidase subunit I [Gammaproteobacteria bacterium]
MINESVVQLSRLQFALTALYHFLFVPLTLGLAFVLAIMESVYVMTGKIIYKDMTRFWGKLFAINFAMGIATGITLEFQFGTNWAYYAHYVGDIFGVPLAIEGLMAFFLESTLVGLFLFGWDRLSKVQHLAVTWLVALGSNLSALWILIANAWMQNPVGTHFNEHTMRMELSSLSEVFFNPVAQVKFVHTVASGYVTGTVFVLGISAYYLLKGRDLPFARRSFAVAAGFGLASILSVIVLGDESGYTIGSVQKAKLAAIEGMWETEPAPAAFTLFGLPSDNDQKTYASLKIPYALGIIATRSLDTPILGLKDLIKQNTLRIRRGMIAYGLLQDLKKEPGGSHPQLRKAFDAYKDDLGFGLLLKRYTPRVVDATEAQILEAARHSVPNSWPLFWSFRIMVGCGFLMLFLFMAAFYYNAKRNIEQKKWLLRFAIVCIPLPWIAAECGWIVAEHGRQPWAIAEILPTFLGVSSISTQEVLMSLIALVTLYTGLLVLELYLMFKYARLGPSSLGTGRYYFEQTTLRGLT